MLFIVFLLFIHSARSMHDIKDGFDYFVFSRQWPTSMCILNNITVPRPHVCRINKNVTGWSIHGLWPSTNRTPGPEFCNNSLHFNMTLLEPIVGELLKHWTNLWADKSATSFWKHEWLKHGTCAKSVPEFDNEYKYFKHSLDLNKLFDISSILEKRGIVPSSRTYHYIQLQKAFDKNVMLFCFHDKTIKVQYLTVVYICLTKSKQWIDCPGSPNTLKQTHGPMKRSVYSMSSRHHSAPFGSELCSDIEPIMYPVRRNQARMVG